MKHLNILLSIPFCVIWTMFSQEPFENILLVINYNHAHYQTIPFIRKLYNPYFNDIVFYGPQEHPDINICHHNNGYISYKALIDAMQKYPHFDGYFFLQDDCIIHPWNLLKKDQSKIWFVNLDTIQKEAEEPISVTTSKTIYIPDGRKAYKWGWWQSPFGYDAVIKTYRKLPQSSKKILARNWDKQNVIAAFSDLVYIPAKYKKKFVRLGNKFTLANTFLEIAVPTIISCIAPYTDWEKLNGYNAYEIPLKFDRKQYPFKIDFIHQIKFSKEENQSFVQKIFS